MINGEVVIAYAWAETYPRLLDQGVPVAYAQPKEGRLAQFPGLLILDSHPADQQLIYDYIDARISPETSKNVIEMFGMIGVNRKGMDLADPQRVAQLGIGNLADEMRSTILFQTVLPKTLEKYVRMYEEVKAGY